MEKTKHKIGWWRASFAAVLSFLFLAILIPNTGRIVVDRSTTPPTLTIADRPQQIAMLVGVLLIPLACIVVGARRRHAVEFVGWIVLVVLFVLATQK